MANKYTDEQILKSIRTSPEAREQVFEYLYLDKDIRKMAFAKINKLISEPESAEDIFVDSLLAFLKNVRYNKFKGQSKLSTYIVSICHYQCLRYLQKEAKKKGKSEQYIQEQIRVIEKENIVNTEHILEENKRYEASLTRKVYRQLTEGCRKAFRQKYGEMLSLKEIAGRNEVEVQSVKNTLSRCYKQLKKIILSDAEIMKKIKTNYGIL